MRKACFHGCSFLRDPPQDDPFPSPTALFRSDFAVSAASSLHQPNPAFTNHESLPSLQESFTNFAGAFPQFLETERADLIRDRHYRHLSSAKHVCLDYSTGHGLFSYSQVMGGGTPGGTRTAFFDVSYKPVNLGALLTGGGPESELDSTTRKRIMRFMNLSEDDYAMVFASNQSAAFRIVADSYPFRSNRSLLTAYDHENEAVDSMIEISRKRGAKTKSAEFSWPNLSIRSSRLKNMIVGKSSRKSRKKGLFVFPLQSRVSGSRYSYSWMGMARENGWHVLLDACALGPKDMETLGLSLFKPDFLICSFYKVFGDNPTGFACLFVKRSSVQILQCSSDHRVGIASLVPFQEERHEEEEKIEFRALNHADEVGLITINYRGRCLINWLVNALLCLRHPDHTEEYSHPLVKIYGPKVTFERGPAVAFNVFDWKNDRVDPRLVQKLADRFSITLSYGFLRHVWFSDGEYGPEFEEREVVEEEESGGGGGSGICVVTAAVGFLTNFEDVYRAWAFVSRFLDADFVENERWRYTALNQQMIEM
ncbi:hypothetical protein SAY87_020980 [Trapa incisa]|uniref:Molybdenum cofactor sulfurase n=1 Tax=Trapa incisa TaxID=236973 RepID=A0AAN7JSD6_9MYRT|nr:hypothetical protein SAY87_020980 [Trapa incisa]